MIFEEAIDVLTYEPIPWLCITLALLGAFLMGFARSAFAAGGFVVSPIMVLALGAKNGLGIVAPLMIFAGALSCYQHRKGLKSPYLGNLIVSAVIGTAIGFFLLYLLISSGAIHTIHRRIEFVVGFLSLIYVCLVGFRKKIIPKKIHKIKPWKSALAGIGVSMSQTVANTGTPILTVFFLFFGIKKDEYVGVQAWFLEVQKVLKLIPFVFLGIIHVNNLGASFLLLPVVILGNWFGLLAFKRINEKTFFRFFMFLLVIGFIASVILLIGRSWFFHALGYHTQHVW